MKAHSSRISSVSFEGFRLDTTNECLWRLASSGTAPERIDLTRKTFGVLRFLIENRGALITHDALLEAVWPDVHVQPEVVKSHIQTIRARLGDSAQRPRYIETLRGRGYRFVARVEIPVTLEDGHVANAWVYFYNAPLGRAGRIESGDYLEHLTYGKRCLI